MAQRRGVLLIFRVARHADAGEPVYNVDGPPD